MRTRSTRFFRLPPAILARIGCLTLTCLSACAGSPRTDAPAPKSAKATPARTTNDAESQATDKSDRAAAAGASAGERDMPRDEFGPPPPAAAPAPLSPDVAERAPGAADPHSPAGRARARLADARREVEIATSERDCARACRALESMERAAQQVCELARSPQERSECASATQQVDKARDKVQNACGGCARRFR